MVCPVTLAALLLLGPAPRSQEQGRYRFATAIVDFRSVAARPGERPVTLLCVRCDARTGATWISYGTDRYAYVREAGRQPEGDYEIRIVTLGADLDAQWHLVRTDRVSGATSRLFPDLREVRNFQVSWKWSPVYEP